MEIQKVQEIRWEGRKERGIKEGNKERKGM
jgi:hypothetical protein